MNNVTNVFKTRLKELRGNKNQTETAKEMGISRSALSYYEAGERTPDINVLCTIAKYYNVTADYLLGLSDIPKPDIDSSAICDKLGLNQCAINNLSQIKQTVLSTPTNEENFIHSYLLLCTINLIINNSDIIESINDVLFESLSCVFKCFCDINQDYDSEEYRNTRIEMMLPLLKKQLIGYHLGLNTFESDSYLLGLTHKLQSQRDCCSKEIAEILMEDSKTHLLTPNEVLTHLRNYFERK